MSRVKSTFVAPSPAAYPDGDSAKRPKQISRKNVFESRLMDWVSICLSKSRTISESLSKPKSAVASVLSKSNSKSVSRPHLENINQVLPIKRSTYIAVRGRSTRQSAPQSAAIHEGTCSSSATSTLGGNASTDFPNNVFRQHLEIEPKWIDRR
jgi:hypothetical protein